MMIRSRQQMRPILIIAFYFLSYILLDFITKQFEGFQAIVAWYPPAGLTYTLLLVYGGRYVPAVTITLFFSSLFIYHMPQPPSLLFLWAIIISLIYGLAAMFLRKRIRFNLQLLKMRDMVWLVVTAVFVSALLAVLSVLSSALSSDIPRNEILMAIFHWWIGETVGVLSITPFLLIYVIPRLKPFFEGQSQRSHARRSFPRPTLSGIGQAISLLVVLYWVFAARVLDEFNPLFLIILPLIWIGLQRGLKGVSAAILALNFGVVIALWLFRFDYTRLGELELIMIVGCIVGLLTGAVVTERKQVEAALTKSEEKFKEIFESANVGKSITLPTGEISVNNAFAELLGYSREELANKTWQELTPPGEIESDQTILAPLLNGEKDSARFEKRYINKAGSLIWADVSTAIRRDEEGKPLYYITTIVDITEHKQVEEEVRRLNEDLEKRVAERTAELRGLVSTMAGREVRMAELKDVIRQLRDQLEQSGMTPVADDPLAESLE